MPRRIAAGRRSAGALIEACAAYAQGEAARSRGPARSGDGNVTVVGGSDAQVDLFRQTYFRSLLGLRAQVGCQGLLDGETAGKTLSPLDRQWLSLAA